jgi:hypothetical protein
MVSAHTARAAHLLGALKEARVRAVQAKKLRPQALTAVPPERRSAHHGGLRRWLGQAYMRVLVALLEPVRLRAAIAGDSSQSLPRIVVTLLREVAALRAPALRGSDTDRRTLQLSTAAICEQAAGRDEGLSLRLLRCARMRVCVTVTHM